MSKRATDDDLPGSISVEKAPRRVQIDLLNYAPRGLSRDEAARHIGIGTTKFDEMVADRRMPRPKRIDGRRVWDRLQVDAAFSDLPEDDHISPFDRLLSKPNKRRT